MTAQDAQSATTPGIVRFAVWLTFFNTWVLFEETVVDRYGLWEYMPYYRVGRLCSWDIGAMALLGFIVWRVFRGNYFFPGDVVALGVLRARSEYVDRVASDAVAGFDERLAGFEMIVAITVEQISVTERPRLPRTRGRCAAQPTSSETAHQRRCRRQNRV